jgi:hypothetical protein
MKVGSNRQHSGGIPSPPAPALSSVYEFAWKRLQFPPIARLLRGAFPDH